MRKPYRKSIMKYRSRKPGKYGMEVLGLSLFPFSENKNMAGTSVSVPTDISVNCKPLRWASTCSNNNNNNNNNNQPLC